LFSDWVVIDFPKEPFDEVVFLAGKLVLRDIFLLWKRNVENIMRLSAILITE
jgi:hypothetical protein